MPFESIVVIVLIALAVFVKNGGRQMKKKRQPGSEPAAFDAQQASQPDAAEQTDTIPSGVPEGTDPCHDRILHGPGLQPTLGRQNAETYMGSLGASSPEGIDPCHDPEAENSPMIEAESFADEGAPGLQFKWEGSELVKAVVMQEILRRPCERFAK